jgi:hypothetical protein
LPVKWVYMKRKIYNTVEDLKSAIKVDPKILDKKIPYLVTINGETKIVVSGNSDQAIAVACREKGATVESIPLSLIF